MIKEVSLGDTGVSYVGRTGETVRFWVEFYEEGSVGPVNLSGSVATLHVRKRVDSAATEVSLSSASGGLSIEPDLGKVEIHIADEQTANLSGLYVWDLRMEFASGDVLFLCSGTFQFNTPTTRST